MTQEELKTIKAACEALDDWLCIDFPDEFEDSTVQEAKIRISNAGGRIAYVTDVRMALEAFFLPPASHEAE